MPGVRTILHPTDFSEASAAARTLACSLAREHGARLILLHAYPYPVSLGDLAERERSSAFADGLIGKLRDLVPDDRTITVGFRVAEGAPTTAILGAAAREGCDLIVMGTHGRSGLRRVLMGSVAEDVSRNARCPVVTVRPAAALPGEVCLVGEGGGEPALDPAPGFDSREPAAIKHGCGL
jgi:nucleotide-binding universal stress UspA family protein